MVRRDDGNRHCLSADDIGTFSHPSLVLLVDRVLRAQRDTLHSRVDYIYPSIHLVSGDMERDDPRPSQLPIPRHHPDGVRDTHRDVGVYLRAALGRMGQNFRLGFVDGGCCRSGICDTVAIFYLVSCLM